jgi:hypothetical protein
MVKGYTTDLASSMFETAKSLVEKSLYYKADLSSEILKLEDFAIEFICGTRNANYDKYIERYYANEISVDELLEALMYPKAEDVSADE